MSREVKIGNAMSMQQAVKCLPSQSMMGAGCILWSIGKYDGEEQVIAGAEAWN